MRGARKGLVVAMWEVRGREMAGGPDGMMASVGQTMRYLDV
jgi:hypothetical protein